jgi:beta-N-acetylhexosaminidase
MVNRLARLWGELPTAADAGAAGRRAVRALGEAAGAACRHLGIHLDLAPVVDLHCSGGCLAGQGRCLSDDPERVQVLARVFNEGLGTWGISGCIKHYPGLGPVAIDTHDELPVLEADEGELKPHLAVFEELSAEIPVVMMAHVVVPALGDTERPASLSRTIVERASALPGTPVILADDLEMGALGAWGGIAQRATAAFRAHVHGVFVGTALDQLDEITETLDDQRAADPAFAKLLTELTARMGTLRRDLCQRAAAVPAPDATTVEQLWEQARKEASR